MSHLQDTDTVIFFFKGRYQIEEKMDAIGIENCYISEITLAELMFGAHNSQNPKRHLDHIEGLIARVNVLLITSSIDLYAKEKVRLRKSGQPIDDFDLLIGCTAISSELTLVTHNTKHFRRIKGIRLEDWVIP